MTCYNESKITNHNKRNQSLLWQLVAGLKTYILDNIKVL